MKLHRRCPSVVRLGATIALLNFSWLSFAQQRPAPPPPLVSPEVHSDGRVTVRFRDPNAKQVTFNREGAQAVPMTKGDDGVWTLTTDPLPPDLYGYSFVADGVGLIDPSNTQIKPNLLNLSNLVHVPAASPQPWDETSVPHGELHHHFYKSGIIGDNRDYYVYTPPNYDPRGTKKYPVLYLLHGYSDDASGWSAVGKANFILDNLISEGKAKPMLIVMPLGYGVPGFASHNSPAFRDASLRQRNFDNYREALLKEVIPAVEKDYLVSSDRDDRAIAGLSMGGAETLFVGLNNLDKFSYVGAFSSGGLGDDLDKQFPSIDSSVNSKLHVLWITCGTEDRLMEFNTKFVSFLNGKGVQTTLHTTPGMHTWMVWRRNLANLAPMLFNAPTSSK